MKYEYQIAVNPAGLASSFTSLTEPRKVQDIIRGLGSVIEQLQTGMDIMPDLQDSGRVGGWEIHSMQIVTIAGTLFSIWLLRRPVEEVSET